MLSDTLQNLQVSDFHDRTAYKNIAKIEFKIRFLLACHKSTQGTDTDFSKKKKIEIKMRGKQISSLESHQVRRFSYGLATLPTTPQA